MSLLRKVALVEHERRLDKRASGSVKDAYPYALRHLVYCTNCWQRAEEFEDPRLRKRLIGSDQRDILRYKHAEGVICECHKRSVLAETIEDEVCEGLMSLRFRQEELAVMKMIGSQIDQLMIASAADLEANRRGKINRAKKRLKALRFCFEEGEIDLEMYKRRKELIEENIKSLAKHKVNPNGISVYFARWCEEFKNVAELWDAAALEEKPLIAHLIFEYILYDLDEQKIVHYQLKPWATVLLQDQDLCNSPNCT